MNFVNEIKKHIDKISAKFQYDEKVKRLKNFFNLFSIDISRSRQNKFFKIKYQI